jgi:hypothetical protein
VTPRALLRPDAFARAPVLASAYLLLALLFWIDWITGYEFGFFIFYFLPVSMVAWWVGRAAGLATACVSALAWYASDQLGHHTWAHAAFLYWETFMRLASFVTTAATLGRIRELVLGRERLVADLAAAEAERDQLRSRIRAGSDSVH